MGICPTAETVVIRTKLVGSRLMYWDAKRFRFRSMASRVNGSLNIAWRRAARSSASGMASCIFSPSNSTSIRSRCSNSEWKATFPVDASTVLSLPSRWRNAPASKSLLNLIAIFFATIGVFVILHSQITCLFNSRTSTCTVVDGLFAAGSYCGCIAKSLRAYLIARFWAWESFLSLS